LKKNIRIVFAIILFVVNLQANKFIKTENSCIVGYNNKNLTDVTVDHCKSECLNSEWCTSFDYYENDKKCDLSRLRSSEIAKGKKSNVKYDHYELNVVKANNLTQFNKLSNVAIPGENRKKLYNLTVDECSVLCLTDPDYKWCVSFDYHKTKKKCYLSDKRASDKREKDSSDGLKADYKDNPWDHYSLKLKDNKPEFFKINNFAIKGHNDKELPTIISVSDCKDECLRYKGCVSFDYVIEEKRCDLSYTRVDNIPKNQISNKTEYSHFMLNRNFSEQKIETVFSTPKSNIIFNKIVEAIDLAAPRSDIYMAFYKLKDTKVKKALLRAKKRDVLIYLLVDKNETNDDIRKTFGNNITPCKEGGCISDEGIMHQKFMLISQMSNGIKNAVFQTSSNLYAKSKKRYQDLIISQNDSMLYDYYKSHFELMKNNVANNIPDLAFSNENSPFKINFLPKDDKSILEILNRIDSSPSICNIHIAMAFFSKSDIARKLVELTTEKDCKISVIDGNFSEDHQEKIEKILKNNIEDYRIVENHKLHTKITLIDAEIEGELKKIVITGTANYTGPSRTKNDETIVEIDDEIIYSKYLDFWKRIKKKLIK
jgi:hypothetical protein